MKRIAFVLIDSNRQPWHRKLKLAKRSPSPPARPKTKRSAKSMPPPTVPKKSHSSINSWPITARAISSCSPTNSTRTRTSRKKMTPKAIRVRREKVLALDPGQSASRCRMVHAADDQVTSRNVRCRRAGRGNRRQSSRSRRYPPECLQKFGTVKGTGYSQGAQADTRLRQNALFNAAYKMTDPKQKSHIWIDSRRYFRILLCDKCARADRFRRRAGPEFLRK